MSIDPSTLPRVDHPFGPFVPSARNPVAPTTEEDRHGLVDDVTFVEGLVFHRGSWFAYHGQSDTTIGVATSTPDDREDHA
ncbi:hypothetical protein [Curtobacterium sp. RRHDQ10]|uniref:hypothetical protein n=1 Tax=Curtobacterium phyllosphaerae TaxID=3413379 RepID=UPI003BF293CF